MFRPTQSLLFLFASLFVVATDAQSVVSVDHAHAHEIHHDHDHLPQSDQKLSFIANQGQWDDRIEYAAYLGGLNRLLLEESRLTFWLFDPEQSADLHDKMLAYPGKDEVFNLDGHAYRVNFVGGQTTEFSVHETQEKRTNYLLGKDQSRWASDVPSHQKIVYESLYPGVQLAAYSEGGNFKYDFIVEAEAAVDQIKLEYEAVDNLYLENGDLVLKTNVGDIRELKPYAYQLIDGKTIEVPCAYQLVDNLVSFDFPEGYNQDYPLTIDPTVVVATLAGSVFNDAFGHSATFDNGGNIYTAGISFGIGYPATTGAFSQLFMGGLVDIAISKFNPDGTDLIYSTYVGGRDREYPYSTIVDDNGQLSFVGNSSSIDYPVTSNAFQANFGGGGTDLVVTKLNADGTSLVGSTYLGGNGFDGLNNSPFNDGGNEVFRGEIVLDGNGNIYIAANSQSTNYPVSANAFQQTLGPSGGLGFRQDGVVSKLNSDLSTLFWSTYLGGTGLDHCSGLRVDDENNVYVTGYAGDEDFPMVGGGFRQTWPGGQESAYVVKLSANGSTMINGTYWGTSSEDRSYFLDIDEDDQIHIYGLTKGDVPITPNTWFSEPGSNQFVTSFTNDLADLVYSTVIGGPTNVSNGNNFIPVAFMVDKCNGIYLSGFSTTDGLPLTTDAVYTRGNSFYLAVLEPNATGLIFASYYGDANHVDGGTSRFDKGGVVYQGVCSCTDDNRVLNTTAGAWATTQNPRCDVGVFKIDFDVEVVTAAGVASPATSGCLPLTIDFDYTGRDAETIRWDFGTGDTNAGQSVTYTFTEAGTYTVTQIAESLNTCNLSDTFRLQVVVLDGNSTRTDLSFCEGEDITFLDASVPGATYLWQDASTAATFQPEENGFYWVDITVDGCTRRDSFVLVPTSALAVELGAEQLVVCDQPSFTLDVTDPAAISYRWQDGSQAPNFTAATSGLYSVTLTDSFGCQVSDEINLQLNATVPVSLGTDIVLCDGDTQTLDATAPGVGFQWQDGSSEPTLIVSEPGIYWVELDNGGCLSRDSMEAFFNPQPSATIVASPTVCFDENNGFITVTETSGGTDFAYRWATGEVATERSDLSDGTYVLTITNEFGCTNTFTEVISRDPEILFDATIVTNPCSPEQGGIVMATAVSGGQSPYLYALDNGPFELIPSFDELRGGTYELTVQDAVGCTASRPVTLIEPPLIVIDAGIDRFIDFADSTFLTGTISFPENMVFAWTPDEDVRLPWRLRTFARPLAPETRFLLSAFDTITGCVYVDSVTIRVDQLREVYFPTGFSPNGDGINDVYFPQSNQAVERINYLRIYSRWGGLVFEELNFSPNNPNFSWDGTTLGKPLKPQVLVYVAEVVFVDGQTRVYSGDLTLLR